MVYSQHETVVLSVQELVMHFTGLYIYGCSPYPWKSGNEGGSYQLHGAERNGRDLTRLWHDANEHQMTVDFYVISTFCSRDISQSKQIVLDRGWLILNVYTTVFQHPGHSRYFWIFLRKAVCRAAGQTFTDSKDTSRLCLLGRHEWRGWPEHGNRLIGAPHSLCQSGCEVLMWRRV